MPNALQVCANLPKFALYGCHMQVGVQHLFGKPLQVKTIESRLSSSSQTSLSSLGCHAYAVPRSGRTERARAEGRPGAVVGRRSR